MTVQAPQNYSVGNLILPRSGPVIIAANVDLTTASEAELDTTTFFERNLIAYIQGVMIDNYDGNKDISLTVNSGTNQRVICPANCQAWLPIFVPNGCTKFNIVGITGSPGIVLPVFFYNIPLQPLVNRKTFPAA